MLPDPEFLAVFRLVLDRVQVGGDVDDCAADVDVVVLLGFVSIADDFGEGRRVGKDQSYILLCC